MQFFDGAIIIIFAGFVWFGYWRGLIETAGSIVGLFLGVILASRWYDKFGNIFGDGTYGHMIFSIAVFIIIFLIITKVTGFIFHLIGKAFSVGAVLPGLKLLNRLAGLLLGAFEGGLFLGVALNFIRAISENTAIGEPFANSAITNFFITFSSWLVPLFPEAIRRVNEIIKT